MSRQNNRDPKKKTAAICVDGIETRNETPTMIEEFKELVKVRDKIIESRCN